MYKGSEGQLAGTHKKIHRFMNRQKNSWAEEGSVWPECATINLRRVFVGTMVAIPVHILHILLFWRSLESGTAQNSEWAKGIILSHAILFLLMTGFLLASIYLKSKPNTVFATMLSYGIAIVMLGAGVVIAAIDQMVTTNITPYLVVCLIVGAVFLIRPVYALVLYLSSYGLFYLLIDLPAVSRDVLLSNRVNGITAIGIGFALSLLLWRYSSANILQQRRIESQQQELERMNGELHKMAFTDSLTGLPNRRYFDEVIRRELAFMKRKGHVSSIIVADLDHFKDINDTYGHFVGDEVLRQTAELLSGALRKSDVISRLGGEEFILMLPETPLAGAYTLAEKLREKVEEHEFQLEGNVVRVTASFGVAQLNADDPRTLTHYFVEADKAMYRAKERGRNKVEPVAQPSEAGTM